MSRRDTNPYEFLRKGVAESPGGAVVLLQARALDWAGRGNAPPTCFGRLAPKRGVTLKAREGWQAGLGKPACGHAKASSDPRWCSRITREVEQIAWSVSNNKGDYKTLRHRQIVSWVNQMSHCSGIWIP